MKYYVYGVKEDGRITAKTFLYEFGDYLNAKSYANHIINVSETFDRIEIIEMN